jgi:hypothetical protein
MVCKSIISSVVLYESETLSLVLREEHKMFETEKQGNIWTEEEGNNGRGGGGGWIKMHEEELTGLITVVLQISGSSNQGG